MPVSKLKKPSRAVHKSRKGGTVQTRARITAQVEYERCKVGMFHFVEQMVYERGWMIESLRKLLKGQSKQKMIDEIQEMLLQCGNTSIANRIANGNKKVTHETSIAADARRLAKRVR